jgi:hypothetical protein
MDISECHPKYVYVLCAQLWAWCKKEKKLPDEASLHLVWQSYVQDRMKRIRAELSHLSRGQLKALIWIALGNDKMITSKETQQKLELTGPTILHSVKVLEDEDYLERYEEEGYRLIDPMIKTILRMYYQNSI